MRHGNGGQVSFTREAAFRGSQDSALSPRPPHRLSLGVLKHVSWTTDGCLSVTFTLDNRNEEPWFTLAKPRQMSRK